MSAKKRCFTYCNDCPNGQKSQWKIVDADSHDAELYAMKKVPCVPCQPKVHEEQKQHCPEKPPCKQQNRCCKGEKGDKGDRGSNFACNLVSVKDPQTVLVIPEPPSPIPPVTESVTLTGWTDIVPDALNSFDNATGIFTAPEDGDYKVDLVVNYQASEAIAVNPNLSDVPTVEIYDVDTNTRILGSVFPTTTVVIQIPPPSSGEPPIDIVYASIMGKSQIIISAIIPLRAGQRIAARALTNGLVFSSGLLPPVSATIDFSPPGADTTFTIYKIRNSPTVTINCNNLY